MVQVIMKPEIFKYATCKEFAEGFALGAEDLVLTNKFIFEPYFGPLGLKVHTIFQEEYGMGEPTDVMCESIMQDAAKTGCKRIIAIGGGTVIDIAKALAVATEDASMDSLYSVMPALTRKYELVIIPTTCGTGSEVTNIAVFNRTRMGTKMGLVGEAMYADKAVLIPELLSGLPFGVFATSSIDALVHAVESCLSPNATSYTKLFGYRDDRIWLQEDRDQWPRRTTCAVGRFPGRFQLCRYCIRYGRLRYCSRNGIPLRRTVSCSAR